MSNSDLVKIKRALISVSDKAGIAEFARALRDMGVELLSTGGTYRLLQEAGLVPALNRTLVQEMLPRISQQVERLMTDLIGAGVMRRVDPEIANWTLMSAVVGLALFSDLGAATILETISVEALAAQVSDIFINGLRGG